MTSTKLDKIRVDIEEGSCDNEGIYSYESDINKTKHVFTSLGYEVEITIRKIRNDDDLIDIEELLDQWELLKEKHLNITNLGSDRISKSELANLFTQVYDIPVSEQTALYEGKRIGLKYEKDWRQTNFNNQVRGFGRSSKGVFVGVKISHA